MERKWLLIASVFGFLGVVLGAFGAHGLKESLSTYHMDVFKTGVHYHLVHAVVLLIFAVLRNQFKSFPSWPGWCFTFGIIIFSASLYALAISGVSKWGMITPIGGLLFLAGWLGLIFSAIKAR